MTLALIANLILATFIVLVVVSPLVWAIHRSHREHSLHPARTRSARAMRSQGARARGYGYASFARVKA